MKQHHKKLESGEVSENHLLDNQVSEKVWMKRKKDERKKERNMKEDKEEKA